MFAEPARTQADIHFRLFGFPIRIHPYFWIVAILTGLRAEDPVSILMWVIAFCVSLIVHELGHAFAQRHFGGHPWITLYAIGGLAACDDCDRSPRSQILISLAGPAAGFGLAAIVVAGLAATGHLEGFRLGMYPVEWEFYDPGFARQNGRFSPRDELILDLLLINIWWGVINLMPVYPLDGGRVAREVITLQGNVREGIIRSLQLSMATAVGISVYGLLLGSILMLLMFGYLAYLNYQTIQAYRQYGSGSDW